MRGRSSHGICQLSVSLMSCVSVSSAFKLLRIQTTVWPIQRMSDVAHAVARRLSCLLVVLGVAFATSNTEGRNRNLNHQHIHPSRRKTSPRSRPIGTVQMEAVLCRVSCQLSRVPQCILGESLTSDIYAPPEQGFLTFLGSRVVIFER